MYLIYDKCITASNFWLQEQQQKQKKSNQPKQVQNSKSYHCKEKDKHACLFPILCYLQLMCQYYRLRSVCSYATMITPGIKDSFTWFFLKFWHKLPFYLSCSHNTDSMSDVNVSRNSHVSCSYSLHVNINYDAQLLRVLRHASSYTEDVCKCAPKETDPYFSLCYILVKHMLKHVTLAKHLQKCSNRKEIKLWFIFTGYICLPRISTIKRKKNHNQAPKKNPLTTFTEVWFPL